MKHLIGFIALILTPIAPAAANQVSLESNVLVEQTEQQPDGTASVTLVEPSRVVPGDNLIFILSYRNNGAEPATDFTVTNPLPDAVQFVDTENSFAVFSVDGGENFGALTDLSVMGEDGASRPASAQDVTHIRWTLADPIAPGASGRLTFRGTVR